MEQDIHSDLWFVCMRWLVFCFTFFSTEQRQEQTLIFRFIDYENFFVMSATVYIDIMKQTRCSIARSRSSEQKKNMITLKNECCSICFQLVFCALFLFRCLFFVYLFCRRQWAIAEAMWLFKSDETLQWTAHSLTQVNYVVATVYVFSCNLKAKQPDKPFVSQIIWICNVNFNCWMYIFSLFPTQKNFKLLPVLFPCALSFGALECIRKRNEKPKKDLKV